MSRMAVSPRPAPLSNDSAYGAHRHIPILSSNLSMTNPPTDAMDITPPSSAKMPPPKTTSPDIDQDASPKSTDTNPRKENGKGDSQGSSNGNQSNAMNAAVAAQTQGQGKVVNTAFIHKLYAMLEDDTISHLISWSSQGDSFVMAPSPDFSKVLAQYFKHTNISSFVRQLNMYGFHKVSDVFHTGNQDQTMWEFRHGNNSFKRGDTSSLREIKRRASRHALIQKDSFPPAPPHRPSISQPGTPAEPVGDPEQRLATLEYSMHDLHGRLMRAEEGNHHLSQRCAWMSESLAQHQRWNNELAQVVMRMTQGRDETAYRDGEFILHAIGATVFSDLSSCALCMHF